MPQFIEKASIIITRVKVPPEARAFFVDWQSRLNDLIAHFPGFLSLEILAPTDERSLWMLVQRFSDASGAMAWKSSNDRKTLFNALNAVEKLEIEEVSSREEDLNGVTEVLITQVVPEKKELYRKWLSSIHQAEAKFPGFRGMYVQSPGEGQGNHWITFLQFDTADSLDRWLASPERGAILKELDSMVTALESHRVITSYAGWFGSIAKIGEMPPAWKQTLLVLLVLFPIVMLEFRLLSPLTQGLNPSLATFIGNAISVSLISWPLMPITIRFFSWWLSPKASNPRKVNRAGTLLLLAIYLLEILIFW